MYVTILQENHPERNAFLGKLILNLMWMFSVLVQVRQIGNVACMCLSKENLFLTRKTFLSSQPSIKSNLTRP